jgi:hypothetical protein
MCVLVLHVCVCVCVWGGGSSLTLPTRSRPGRSSRVTAQRSACGTRTSCCSGTTQTVASTQRWGDLQSSHTRVHQQREPWALPSSCDRAPANAPVQSTHMTHTHTHTHTHNTRPNITVYHGQDAPVQSTHMHQHDTHTHPLDTHTHMTHTHTHTHTNSPTSQCTMVRTHGQRTHRQRHTKISPAKPSQ